MTGPKLNDGALLVPEGQPTTKATAKYLRGSASKAREVLDLIRGLDVRRADEVLQFTTRDVAKDVRKVLASAVANAQHNDAQDPDELFVLAAYADEGPTLRRFRPRARGRATRIRKRTSHITIVVTRLSDERLEVLQARQQATSPTARRRAGTSAQSRRDRVERSRTRAQGLRSGGTSAEESPSDEAESSEPQASETSGTELPEHTPGRRRRRRRHGRGRRRRRGRGARGRRRRAGRRRHRRERPRRRGRDRPTPAPRTRATPSSSPTARSWRRRTGRSRTGYEIKGNQNSMKYHVPGGRYYDITIAEVFFDTAEHAEAAGYEAPAADTEEND